MNNKSHSKIVVGLSGGVDSSTALYLLKEQGYQPVGVLLDYSTWSEDTDLRQANTDFFSEAFNNAKKVCQKLKVPFYKVSCQQEFKKEVIDYFLKTLSKKETPNPCVVCNPNVKIKKLLAFAKSKGIKLVATGHYAEVVCRCEEGEGRRGNLAGAKPGFLPTGRKTSDPRCECQLLKGKDSKKDQSYFLCLLNQKQLGRLVFPLGRYTKKQVYQIAAKNGLEFLSRQKESQDLCFLSERSLPSFLEQKIGYQPGEIVDTKGTVLGEHRGLHFYTIGQRRGIYLSGGPWWVVGFDKNKNRLIITNKEKDPALYAKEIEIVNYSFISGQAPKKKMKVMVKPRYLHPAVSAVLYPAKSQKMKLVFAKPQKAVTPGQWAVFYNKDACLGGGMISL